VTLHDTLPRTTAHIERGIAERLHLGAQVYVSRDGQILADDAIGKSRPGVAMTRDTLNLWLSCTKPITAVGIARLWEQGKLDLDDRVATHVPEFGVRGKEVVTIRHILTHTGGFPVLDVGWPNTSWDEIIARICQMPLKPGWRVGRDAGYHVATSWFMLGEIIQRLSAENVSAYMRREILEPIGMIDSWIGMPRERYHAYGDRLGVMFNTESGELRPHAWQEENRVVPAAPGGNGWGPIRELGKFYEMLLNRGGRLLRPQTVETLTARHRVGLMDRTFKHVMDWGLGFIINSNQYGPDTVPYGYGPHASARTFGHGGSQSSTGFCDPEHRLVVAIVLNGTPGEAKHQQRMREILAAIYEDLGLPERSTSA
jgi:CubicO group peptidase (beta-lactamase class C family)